MEILVVGILLSIIGTIAWNVYVRSKGGDYWFNKAEYEHFFTKNNNKALTYINRALRIVPKNKEYLFLKSHILHKLGRHEEARELEAELKRS